MFGFEYIDAMIETCLTRSAFEAVTNDSGDAFLQLPAVDDRTREAGTLRLWRGAGETLIDRMIHFRLVSDPVDTQLFFLFGRAATTMPHFHAQVVQFGPDACVFNADFLPRLDPIEHPGYFDEVFTPLNKPYWKAINDTDNVCALAPASPSIAALLSPWSIGCGRPTTRAELERVSPQIQAFVDHYLNLSDGIEYPGPNGEELRRRDRLHLDRFFDDRLDPRAWKGVYGVIGEPGGQRVKAIFKTELRADG